MSSCPESILKQVQHKAQDISGFQKDAETTRKKVYLILLSDITSFDFLNNPNIQKIKKEGVIFNFQKFVPLEPKTAFTYAVTGCNPGKIGFLEMHDNLSQFKETEGYGKTILSLLSEEGFSEEYLVDNIPTRDADFSLICLRGPQLLDKVLNIIMRNSAHIFLIAPIFEEYSEKAVNINNFLKEKKIIETDANGEIIWENSLAYSKEYGQLWINLIGREPQGAVPPEEYNEVREALIKGITEKLIDDENGQSVIDRIYKKEELFKGEHILRMPDLVVTLKQGYGFSSLKNTSIFDESAICSKTTRTYTRGGCVIMGENIRKGSSGKELNLLSIAPMILHCMRCSIPPWIDGIVEEEIFNKEFISQNPPTYEHDTDFHVLSEEDEGLIKDRLKDLGYLG